MSCRKYGFLSPKNLPAIEGVVPILCFNEEIDHNWWEVSIWKNICSDYDMLVCDGEARTFRLAKKKAFKQYREITKKGFIDD